MKHKLTADHQEHLRNIGIVGWMPSEIHTDTDEYNHHYQAWSKTLPGADHNELHKRTLANIAWKKHASNNAEAKPVHQIVAVDHRKELRWLIAVLGVIALLLLFSGRAHAQFSKITTITAQNNDNSQQGFFASPFTFKAGANCSFSVSGSTATFNCAGGAAGAGGVNTQVQWNSTGSLAGISSLTTDGTITTALAGADWLFADLTTPTKKFQFDASNISAVTTRTMNVPDANATFAQAISAVSHKFITQMSAQGVFTLAQPDYSDLTGTPTLAVTIANASHKWLNSYTSGTGAFTQTQPDYSDLTGVPATFAPSAHNLLSSAHGDTTAASAVRGDGIFAIGAGPTWQRLAHPATTGGYFKWNGTDIVASSGAASGTGTPTACSNQFVTGLTLNADAAPTSSCTTATLASAQFANQGTTTTVLHGNGAGNPSFGSVTTSDLASTTGNGTQVATGTGTYTSGNCVKIDANGNLVDNGSACGGGSSAQMFAMNTNFAQLGASTTSHLPLQGTGGFVSDQNARIVMSHACSFKNLRVDVIGAQPASGSLTVSLDLNNAGVNTALVATIAANGTTQVASDLTHSVATVAGDKVSWIVINNATGTSIDIQNISADCQ